MKLPHNQYYYVIICVSGGYRIFFLIVLQYQENTDICSSPIYELYFQMKSNTTNQANIMSTGY